MATNYTSSSNPRTEKMGDVLDALSSGIAKTAANEPKFEPQLHWCLIFRHLCDVLPSSRQWGFVHATGTEWMG